MNWRQSLDNWLTSGPPEDGFDIFCEDIIGHYISDAFFEENEDWLISNNGQCIKWLNRLFDKSIGPEKSAKIIERAFKIFIKTTTKN